MVDERASSGPLPSPETADAVWFVLSQGQESGPFTLEELKAKAASGDLDAESLVREGNSSWAPAKSVHFLATNRLERVDTTPPSVPAAVQQTSQIAPLVPGRSSRKLPWSAHAKCAVASLVCGIIALAYPAFVTGPICSIVAIVLGILGLQSQKRKSAIAGIVLGSISLVLFALLTYLEYQNRRMLNDLMKKMQ